MRCIHSKRGVMGIETLIIFIAMILVSAVAAGVLLKTVGTLQQRALAVGNEARERLATGVEINQITANANVSTHSTNELEALIRLMPGSYDVQLLSTSITLNSINYAFSARLMNRQHELYRRIDILAMDNETWVNVGNLDHLETDVDPDFARLIFNLTPTSDGIEFDLSGAGTVIVDLEETLQTNGTINIRELPIKHHEDGNYGMIYGFINIQGTGNNDGTIGGDLEMYIETDIDACIWEKLIPNYRFCYITRIGNTDTIVESGELIVLRYKLSEDAAIGRDTTFDFSIAPKRGAIQNILVYTPEVFNRRILILWP